MKRMLLLSLGLLFLGSQLFSQFTMQDRASVNPMEDYAVERPVAGDRLPLVTKPANPTVSTKLAATETTIGGTRYDLQTNTSTQNRLWVYDDGTVGATWTQGLQDAAGYPDRGTGYNYFDGTSWGPEPTSRIESMRTGWPSYAPYGSDGEIVVCHDFTPGTGGLVISTRATKGTGTWNESTFSGPTGHSDVAWPRMVTSGANNDIIHMIYVTKSTANGGTPYNGLEGAILYSRSSDGGTTWNPKDQILTGMTSSDYHGFPADGYTWAAPRGDTLAFVVSDSWFDLFMMKSTDGGDNWTKTVIWEHPYPLFNTSSPTVTDTFYCPDGAASIAFDKDGMAHVTFGVNRGHSDGTGTFYFPFVDGIAYWNESMPMFDSPNFKYTLQPDSLYSSGHLVAWTQDINGNDTLDFLPGSIEVIGTYFLGLSSMPNMVVADNGDIGLVYSSVTEGKDNGLQNFRHIWSTYKVAGQAWSETFTDQTGSILHNFDECVFPTLAPTSWAGGYSTAQMIYQADEEPGLAIRGDEDAPTDNDIIHSVFDFMIIDAIDEVLPGNIEISTLHPNPASTSSRIAINLKERSDISISILSLTGQLVRQVQPISLSQGAHAIEIDVSSIAPGAYILNVSDGYNRASRKLIIQ